MANTFRHFLITMRYIYLHTRVCSAQRSGTFPWNFSLSRFVLATPGLLFILSILDSCILCVGFVVTIAAATNYFHFWQTNHFELRLKPSPVEDIVTASIGGTNCSVQFFQFEFPMIPVDVAGSKMCQSTYWRSINWLNANRIFRSVLHSNDYRAWIP